MSRSNLGLVAAGLLTFVTVGEASACGHKKKAACAPAPAVCAPAPAACQAPARKKHHFKLPKLGCHKKKHTAVCETAPAPCYTPVAYASAAPQHYGTPQAYGAAQAAPAFQMPPVPGK